MKGDWEIAMQGDGLGWRQKTLDSDDDLSEADWSGGLIGAAIEVTARADRVGSMTPRQGTSALTCKASEGTTSAQLMLNSNYFPDGRIGLRTFGMTAWFDYSFAVEPRPR